MELQKTPININFRGGVDRKTDPYQIQSGKFFSLVNSVFDSLGRLTKRNGFPMLTPLPNVNTSYLTTFSEDLQAVGNNLLAYSPGQKTWIQKGSTYPIRLSTKTLIRNSTNQSQCDSAIASNGLICTVFTDQTPSSLATPIYKYVIADSGTGQNIVSPTPIPVATGAVTNAPRVFLLGNYFVIVFENLISATPNLQFVAISTATPTIVSANTTISTSFAPATTLNYDGVVANGNLYLAWNGASSSGIKMAFISSNLTVSPTVIVDAAHVETIMSVTADLTQSTPVIWVSYYNLGTTAGYTLAVDNNLNILLSAHQFISSGTVLNLTSAAQNSVNTVFYELANNYSFDSSSPSHFIDTNTITESGTVGSPVVSIRSLGLASKAFIIEGVIYYLGAFSSSYQPTYFLVNGSTSRQAAPIVIAKLASGNGGGYLTTGLPNAVVSGTTVEIPYLYKDLIQSVNKNTNIPAGSQFAGIYSQTGINSVTFNLDTKGLQSTEIGNNLNLTGGFLWGYDGYLPVEQNFLIWPEPIEISTATTGGHLADQTYFYQVTYEWTDNQGNAFRSAPSIPVSTVTSGGGASTNTIHVPTLRLTYKIANPVKIVVYRWSTAQQSYYQVTSITTPIINSTTTDSIAITDTLADSSILGNNLIYTTGGVVEDLNAPSSSITTLFDDRLWLVDAEDTNLLWFSKQVIESTPVEMSDLFTFYVAPTIGAQASTGPITALFPMDDKLIIFKKNAAYYINGSGPDNTGSNNQYSQPIFIPGTVGCDNPRSIALIPNGLMFQSDKGIWLLGRDLQMQYIGAEVEAFNEFEVTSATVIPGTTQVRFAISNGEMLMYDYFVGQWGEFQGIPSVSSTLYNDLHTIINKYGQVSQELPGTYLDGSNPVLLSFVTAWLNLAGLRGYQRGYFFFPLGTYLSPFKLQTTIAYDYNSSPSQYDLITPSNFNYAYGLDPYYGGDGTTPYGGIGNIIQQRIFLERQRCKAFQISMTEVYDPSFGVVAGAGLTLSGINAMLGFKKAYAPISASRSVG